MSFLTTLEQQMTQANSLLCVGLDTDHAQLPQGSSQLEFNKDIIDQTHDLVCSYKLNLAFYEATGAAGWDVMHQTVKYIHEKYPGIPVIADAKRADIGSTSAAYAEAIFDELEFDAVTLHPYLGSEAVSPFLDYAEKGCIVLVHTSNPGAGEFQDLQMGDQKLWQVVLKNVDTTWNQNGNCLAVLGATYPDELTQARQIAPNMTFLVPGVGAQGGSARDTVLAGRRPDGKGLIINSSRGVIFADSPRDAAQQTVDAIRAALAE